MGDTSITATVEFEPQSATYSSFTAAANNDCPTVGSPTSITVAADQQGAAGSIILCISRPESIGAGAVSVTTDANVRLLSLSGNLDCSYVLTPSPELELEATFSGFCDDGVAAEGFSMRLVGTVPVTYSCPGQEDVQRTVQLNGSTTVTVE